MVVLEPVLGEDIYAQKRWKTQCGDGVGHSATRNIEKNAASH
jgi:hypothetical protein